jgi:glycosyltransferase involved in cell wall biosynthesis
LFHLSYWPIRWQLNRADAIATVSQTARQELIDAHATKRDIVTVSNAVGDAFTHNETQSAPKHHLSNSIVYMGAFTPYKNVECLIDALVFLPEITLHLCSKIPPSRQSELETRMQEKGVFERVVIYDGATDEQYREALQNARCSISASRIEGFGLPVLEAQAMGVPFVAADTPIFHEVGGDSILYFDPDSPEEAADAIRALADSTLSRELIQKGTANAARFTWDNSAKSAVSIAEKVH